MQELETGKAEILTEGSDVALLTLGHTALDGATATARAKEQGLSVCHIDLRWAKPLDEEMLHYVGRNFKRVVTVEDGVLNGGIGSALAEWMNDNGYNSVKLTRLGIDDTFVEHGTLPQLKALAGYDADAILKALVG